MKRVFLKESITGIGSFGFYRIETCALNYMREHVSALLTTYQDNEGSCVALVSLTKSDFEFLAQIYKDTACRYLTARRDSKGAQLAIQEPLYRNLAANFPNVKW